MISPFRRFVPVVVVAVGVMLAACAGGTSAQSTTAAARNTGVKEATEGDRIGSLPAYDAPVNWGTKRSPNFTFRYPPEYTADLDFPTREIVVTRREGAVELIRVAFFDSEDPVFRKVADDVAFYKEIVGSAKKTKKTK